MCMQKTKLVTRTLSQGEVIQRWCDFRQGGADVEPRPDQPGKGQGVEAMYDDGALRAMCAARVQKALRAVAGPRTTLLADLLYHYAGKGEGINTFRPFPPGSDGPTVLRDLGCDLWGVLVQAMDKFDEALKVVLKESPVTVMETQVEMA